MRSLLSCIINRSKRQIWWNSPHLKRSVIWTFLVRTGILWNDEVFKHIKLSILKWSDYFGKIEAIKGDLIKIYVEKYCNKPLFLYPFHVHVHARVHVHMHFDVHVHIHAYENMYLYRCVFMFMYLFMYMFLYMLKYTFMCIFM